ncbi:MAG: hypothetical protein BWY46_01401 [Firmicutes bacterium ADurb.Bin300]|nr:MAG: hypothetical protein BWY46_01401 [Firmicutes bacterium ADurb.Bin300]
MKKLKTRVGYIAYKVTQAEICKIGGFGICDTCNSTSESGYLVPVLNRDGYARRVMKIGRVMRLTTRRTYR